MSYVLRFCGYVTSGVTYSAYGWGYRGGSSWPIFLLRCLFLRFLFFSLSAVPVLIRDVEGVLSGSRYGLWGSTSVLFRVYGVCLYVLRRPVFEAMGCHCLTRRML